MQVSIRHRSITTNWGIKFLTVSVCIFLAVVTNSHSIDKNQDQILNGNSHLLWSTYYGGDDIETPGDIAVDNNGNIYFCGVSSSSSNITTAGVHQATIRGFSDIFIVKFNSNGQRIWGTYFGGSRGETNPHIAVDRNNNIIISGSSKSADNIATAGAYDDSKTNNEECTFFAKFNSNGQLIISSYFVSEEESKVTGLDLDNSGNIYISGTCYQNPGFATNGAFLTTENHAYLAKFNSNGNLEWSTYYGGNERVTEINDIAVHNGIIAVIGYSNSTDLSTSNAHQEILSGNYDGYLTLFSTYGVRAWSTYYGGTAIDEVISVCFNNSNEIGICGLTKSMINISSDNSYKESRTGSEDGFVAKFNIFGVRSWGTYFGGSESNFDLSIGIDADSEDDFVVLGINSSSDIGTHGTHQPFRADANDMYVAKFKGSGEFLWCSYFGGSENEGVFNDYIDLGKSIAVDGLDNIIIASQTLSTTGIATVSAHQTELVGTESDLLIAKFAPFPNRLITNSLSGEYCAGDSIDVAFTVFQPFDSDNEFTIQLSDKNGSFVAPIILVQFSGTSSNTNRVKIPTDTELGTNYRIRVIANSPFSTSIDNGFDLSIYPQPKAEIIGESIFCKGSLFEFESENKIVGSYKWEVENCDIISNNNEETVLIEFPKLGKASIQLYVENEYGCSDSTALELTVHPTPKAQFELPESLCSRRTIKVRSFVDDGISILWNIENGSVDRNDTSDIYISWDEPGHYYLRQILTDTLSFCSDTLTKFIEILESPLAEFVGADTVCQDIVENYIANIDANSDYQWLVKGGMIIGSETESNISVQWSNDNKGSIKLVLVNKVSGCKDSSEIDVVIARSPDPKIYGDESVCSEIDYIYYSNDRVGFSNHWSIENGEIQGDPDADSVIVIWNSFAQGKLTLKQISSSGKCSAETEIVVNISEGSKAFFIAETAVCINSIIEYTAESKTGNQYKWQILGGLIQGNDDAESIDVLWNTEGQGLVKLIVTNENNCIDSLIIEINVIALSQTEIQGNPEICLNETEIYHNDFDDDIQWFVDGGTIDGDNNRQNVTVIWDQIGLGKVSLIRTINHCHDTTELIVKINPLPIIDLQAEDQSCQSCMKEYIETNAGTNFWYITNGVIVDSSSNSKITVKWDNYSDEIITGIIKLVKISDAGCQDSVEIEIELLPKQNFIRGLNRLCSGDIEEYRISENPNQTYSWSIIGGILLTDPNMSSIEIEWPDPGLGQIQLVVFKIFESKYDTLELEVQIFQSPKAVISGFANVNRFSSSSYSTIVDGTEIEWKVEGGSLLTDPSESISEIDWGTPGIGKLTLIKSNSECSDTIDMTINIIDSDANAILSVKTFTASPGEIIEIPIRLNRSVGILDEGITGFETELSLNSTLLVPLGNTPKGIINDGILYIRSIVPATPIDEDILVKYRFMATLGNSQSTILNLIESKPVGGIAVVNDLDGRFVLNDLCEDGGTRLVINTNVLTLQQSYPNPANDEVTISFTLIEPGMTSLKIYDNLGGLKRTPVNTFLHPNIYNYTIDLQDLPSGVYGYILQTPTQILTKFMQIIK